MTLSEKDLARLLEATRSVASTLRLSELLRTVLRLAKDVVQAETGSVLLLDPATEELYFEVALGDTREALQQVRLKKGEGIAGWVAETRRPALVNDALHDPRWTQKADQTSQFKTKSILAVPMQVKDKLIGVMEAINRLDGTPFTEMDVEILETFAAQAAIAIENARLFESVRQEKEKMATILGEMTEGVLLLDPAGRVSLANPAAHRLLGKSSLTNWRWADLEVEFDRKPTGKDASLWPETARVDLARKAAPPLLLSGVVQPVRNDRDESSGHLIVFSDVTEERRESQLKKNFLSLVSHKLKTPLVAIRGFAPILLEKPEELSSFQRTSLEAIDRNSQHLGSLLEKLLGFAALEGETFELARAPNSMASILDLVLSELAPYFRVTEAEIQREAGIEELPLVAIDKIWIKEAIRNILENAVKFNPRAPRKVYISGEVRVQDKLVILRVADNGPGIPSEERSKIFTKFYQIEGAFTGQIQGMGLGLALAKRVIEEHGGRVQVESELGKGSVFVISLPLMQEEQRPS